MNYTVQELKDLMVEAKTAAKDAAVEHLNKYGEHAYCGFAWVNIYAVSYTHLTLPTSDLV